MLGEALASILRSRLGQYLDTQDLEVNVAFGKEIVLKNVKLKESALRDAGIPLRCVYGKIQRLEIKIPWTSIYSKPTVINIVGLYMLMVPASSVPYDQEKEEKSEQEAKMAKIQSIEEAKQRVKLVESKGEEGDTFIQKLTAKIFENLQVTIRDVHIRIEDNSTNRGYPFGAGISLDKLEIRTNKDKTMASNQKYFLKSVDISSLAFYWQPHEKMMYSEQGYSDDGVRDIQFQTKIARNEDGIKGLKYLLGPVSVSADLCWCPDPKKVDFSKSLIDLNIKMEELRVRFTKYQYYDFAMLLQSLNSMILAAKYRKYKVQNDLDGLPNYSGRSAQLWRFARDAVLEEEVRPKLQNWNLKYIMQHTANCREYRELYKDKLLGSKSVEFNKRLEELEIILDVFNINLNRELAEAAASARRKEEAKQGYFNWFWGKKENKEDAGELEKALTQDERAKLYDAIGYQEDAEEGTLEYPRRFVRARLGFLLAGFRIELLDEDLKDSSVLTLHLDTVSMEITQRPAAGNMLVSLAMQSLTVTGIDIDKSAPKVITTVSTLQNCNLLSVEYEINPPADPGGNLDEDKGSVYDRRLFISSSPLEIVYDMKTVNHVMEIFKPPEELQISYLQETAMETMKEYKEVRMSKLGWEYVIQNHKFMDVNIQLESSYIVIPYRGVYTEGCPALIANLGSISIKSGQVTQNMKNSKKQGGLEALKSGLDPLKMFEAKLKENLLEQAYDKFAIKLENMELMLALRNENWRLEICNKNSKLHLLKPINVDLSFKYCLIQNDPDFPITKLHGGLPVLGLCIEEQRLLMLAELMEKILDPDDEDKFVSKQTLKRTDSDSSFSSAVSSLGASANSFFIGRKKNVVVPVNVPELKRESKTSIASNVVQLDMSFNIEKFKLDIEKNEIPLFKFEINGMGSKILVKKHCLVGEFEINSCVCEHIKFKMPDGSAVKLLNTDSTLYKDQKLLSVKYTKLNPNSPDWAGVQQSIDAILTSVHFCVHQDAILDLAKESALWMTNIQSRAAKLMVAAEAPKTPVTTPNRDSPLGLKRQGARRLSRQNSGGNDTSGGLMKSIYKPKGRVASRSKLQIVEEPVQFRFFAQLKEVGFSLMTSYADFSSMRVENLIADLRISRSQTTINAKLMEFQVFDSCEKTQYKMIAKSTDAEVFHVNITLNDNVDELDKQKGMPDVLVKANMSRLRVVFLMKYVKDLLLFIDPFTNMKEYVMELSAEAGERTVNLAKEIYSSATRVKLDISIKAPVIIIPIHSESKTTFEANLGILSLRNRHRVTPEKFLMDELSFEFSDITLSRSETGCHNESSIIEPISFEMELARNMNGAVNESDPPDIKVTGVLEQVKINLLKEDYDNIITLLSKNFGEIGVIKAVPMSIKTNSKLNLPIKPNYQRGSRASLISQEVLADKEKKEISPKAKTTDFKFTFKKFSLQILNNSYCNDQHDSLAEISIDQLVVDGDMTADEELYVVATLKNVILEDTRHSLDSAQGRIVRLLESKMVDNSTMAEVTYQRFANAEELLNCKISSFTVVASVSYLLKISEFFIPNEVVDYDEFFAATGLGEGGYYKTESEPEPVPVTRRISFRMDEPDIILVNDIEDKTTDAILFNAQLNMNIVQQQEKLTFNMTLDDLRGHTCKFDPKDREQTLAQILKPTNMAMHFSQDTESRRTRIDMNFSSLVLNVSPASIMILLQSYNTLMLNFQALPEDLEEEAKVEESNENLWRTADIVDDEMWYLKPDEALDLMQHADTMSLASTVSNLGDEHLMFKVKQLIITMESGRGNNTVPLVLLESKVEGEVRNWSWRLWVGANLELEAAYYNSKVALWEPIIEPIQVINQNGPSFNYRWSLDFSYQSNSVNELGSALLSPNFNVDEPDTFVCPENLPPLTELKLSSSHALQITITRTFLSVMNNMIESFSLAGMERTSSKVIHEDPLILRNQMGREIKISLADNKQLVLLDHSQEMDVVSLPSGSEKAFGLRMSRSSLDCKTRSYTSPLQQQTEESSSAIRLKIVGENTPLSLPISKTDMRFFPFQFRGCEFGYEEGFVSKVEVENCSKIITLQSMVIFKNYYPTPVKVWTENNGKFRVISRLEKGKEWNAPISDIYTQLGRFYFSLDGQGQNMGLEFLTWKEIELSGSVRRVIECSNSHGNPSVFFNVEGLATDIFRETSRDRGSSIYTISIRPVVVLKNCLPIPLYYSSGKTEEFKTLIEGEIGCLEDVRHGHSMIRLKLYGWRYTDLACDKVFEDNMKELEFWRFESTEPETSNIRLDLGVQKEYSKGTIVLSVFAPFWLVNKTKRTLYYKGHDSGSEVAHYPDDEKLPLMFSYITKSLFGKKKISLKMDSSQWSDPFTIDTIGDTGKIICKLDTRRGSLKRNFIGLEKSKEDAYSIGIQISQSSTSLTKIITFTPYFMVYNSADFNILMKEVEDELGWTTIPAKECVPIWPIYGGKSYICKAENYPETTVPFSILDINTSLLMLSNKYGGIDVRVKTDNSQVLVTLAGYKTGYAPVLLVNNTPSWFIEFGELGSSNRKFLAPGKKCLYTWEKPSGGRTLVWSVQDLNKPPLENSLKSDAYDSFKIGNGYLSWVSFLDGMQRVLLFTNNGHLAERLAKTTGEMERIEQEIEVSISAIGVSLVNNSESVRKELAYLSVTCSDTVWEVRKEGKQRYRPLTVHQSSLIENDFKLFNRLLGVNKNPNPRREIEDGLIILDYREERMEKPHRGRVRRQFQKGLWLQVRTSPHQRQIHMKVNHIQLDNQLLECLYPVIAAPVPPPKSVMADSVPKPFIELSILEYTSPAHVDLKQYKYIHALIQEMQLKIELGFVNAISELFEDEEILEENTKEKLELDLEMARKPLQEHAILTVSQGQKDFYDYLHMSPLKIHVSFSLTSHNARRDGTSHRGSNFIGLLLQSFGVTITDSNDIIFRLAYFERKHQFYGFNDLTTEISRHYTSQAVKQMYVVLLGLDVIGNPFGLAVGVARSVEDLFYEPFQGAVEGPGEFAEGLAIGVRSVFSGVVGGAAGTVSKITGALGKGLASLTFDEKFQNKRRETIKRRENQTLMDGMAVNVRDLSMGFVGGVTGVFTKPYEGASKEGVSGFFKGVGKGVAGLVTRPTGGIVDFASGTFDTVKRATEVGDEFKRARPARYIHPDGVVRYYDRKEAEGQRILSQVEKGRYAAEDTYMLHEYTIPDKEVFLVTNKRLLYLHTVLGSWTMDWEFEFSKIQGPPSVLQEGGRWYIIIQPLEEKKNILGGLFTKNSGMKVFLPEGSNKGSAQLLARVIEDLRTSKNNFETIFIEMIQRKAKLN